MKKFFLILYFCFFSADIFAQNVAGRFLKKSHKPVVIVEGFSDFTAVAKNQNSIYEKSHLPGGASNEKEAKRFNLANDSEVYFKVAAISDSGVKYGGVFEIEADTALHRDNNGVKFDKAFIFTETKIGKFELGNNHGVNQKMKVGVGRFARATGGIAGKYLNYVNFPVTRNSSQNIKLPRFILAPQSPAAHGGYARGFYDNDGDYKNGSFSSQEDATKINYYTPRIDGWQFGLSFTPKIDAQNDEVKNIVSVALNYVDSFDNLGYAFSMTGEHGESDSGDDFSSNFSPRNKLNSVDFGLMFTYFGFTFGGSYGYFGDSLESKSGIDSCIYDESRDLASQTCIEGDQNIEKFSGANYYTLGLAYEFGPFATSVTAIKSEFQRNEYEAISFGLDYKKSRGIMPYFEITKFEFSSYKPSFVFDNEGYVGLAGVLFAF